MNCVYEVWHQLMFGFGTARSWEVMEHFPSSKTLYDRIVGGDLPKKELLPAEWREFRANFQKAEQAVEATYKKGCRIITPADEEYPPLLREAKGRPAALHVKGDLSALNSGLAMTVVGSRVYSEYGEEAARYFVDALVKNQVSIVSGLALGIDSISLETAVKAGGKAFGVLGCGIDVHYPKGNEKIKRGVAENGAVLSEYPMGFEPHAFRFPVRNRIMAAMSHGVLVVEAGENSGALNTARQGLDYNREVFAVPGKIFMGTFKGSHRLINESTAKLVTDVFEVLEEFRGLAVETSFLKEEKPAKKVAPKTKSVPQEEKSERKPPPEGIDNISAKIYEVVESSPQTADDIAVKTGIEISQVLGALTMLEIFGVIKSLPGGYFVLS